MQKVILAKKGHKNEKKSREETNKNVQSSGDEEMQAVQGLVVTHTRLRMHFDYHDRNEIFRRQPSHRVSFPIISKMERCLN